jgi:hypothetical protein
MFREIRRSERITDEMEKRRRESENWKRIKPERYMTDEEMNITFRAIFGQVMAESQQALSQGK